MNYDRIILELLNRVQILEEQIAEIKAEFSSRGDDFEDDNSDGDEENEQDEITRSQARDKAMKIMQSKNPDYLVQKASRKEGSGIKVHKPNPNVKKPIIIKFYHSKTHNSGEFEHGWHVVRLDDVLGTVIDYCMFSIVDSKGDWNFFIYEPDELGMYYEDNRSSDNDILHLYFVVKGGKATEVRENPVDVSDHLNNWDILK